MHTPALPTRRRIYLARHGDVRYFDDQGRPFRPNEVALSAEGRRQAEALAGYFRDVPLDRVVSSDLARSVETASLVIQGHSLRVEALAALREVQPGRLADLAPDAVQQAFVGAFGAALTRDSRFLGGETFGAL